MYQFYYADMAKGIKECHYKKKVSDFFLVSSIRPTMWEEHCLECSAPVCYDNCILYEERIDGRCKRFLNGFFIYHNSNGCCEEAMRIKFKKWSNMLTVIFSTVLNSDDYYKLNQKNKKLGKGIKKILQSKLPTIIKWDIIRAIEYVRRNRLRKLKSTDDKPDAFIFHGYSFEKESFHLIVEVFDDHTPLYRTSILIQPGENLSILESDKLDISYWKKNNLIKIYPENDIEAELDILWCDFVKGTFITKDKPADKVKCIVWDLDNTLWDGILIETDDVNELNVKPEVINTIRALDERGIIQSIASKNDFEEAWSVVKTLGLSEYFIYPQIHWNAKSSSIRQIAKNLNIGIDTFALIDDSIFERKQVENSLPQVRTYDVTEIPFLLQNDEFDVLVTEESKKRRIMYKAEEKRNNLMMNDNLDTVEFIKRSGLTIKVFQPKTAEVIERCYELVVRTNQLNMSGVKYNKAEFYDVLEKPEHFNFAFECSDYFGNYGIVGYGQYKKENGKIIFSEFAMSCRVAGKYVESALFGNILDNENASKGFFKVFKTKKNILLRKTLIDIGFHVIDEDDFAIEFCFDHKLKNIDLVAIDEGGNDGK